MKARIILLIYINLGFAFIGVDITNILTQDNFKCLLENKLGDDVIARAYKSTGIIDTNAYQNLKNAEAAGFQRLDIYVFPCVPCGNAKKQIQDAVDSLKDAFYSRIFLMVENFAWSDNKMDNQQFISDAVWQIKSNGKQCGIMTHYISWENIAGEDFDEVAFCDLIFTQNDWNPSFQSYIKFGGWDHPTLKQFELFNTTCNVSVNLDFYQ